MSNTNRPMTDEAYVAHIGRLYQHILALRKDSDYVINQPQMDRLVELLDYFIKKAKVLDGEVERVDLKPAQVNGDVVAQFPVFDSHGDDVPKFCKVLSYCSAIGIDAMVDGTICIACTVPNVFVPKS